MEYLKNGMWRFHEIRKLLNCSQRLYLQKLLFFGRSNLSKKYYIDRRISIFECLSLLNTCKYIIEID